MPAQESVSPEPLSYRDVAQDALTPATASSVEQTQAPPYAAFVLRMLFCAVLIAFAILNIALSIPRNRWDQTSSTAVAIIAAILLARAAHRSWHGVLISEPQTDTVRRRNRKVILTSTAIVITLFLIAAVTGTVIGQGREELLHVNADSELMSEIGKRISTARTEAERTVPEQLRMYTAIESDVGEFDSALRRLRTELAAWDSHHPEQHESTIKSISAVDIALRRSELLKQQIATAKRIDQLDATQQWAVWVSEMKPLLQREDALENAGSR